MDKEKQCECKENKECTCGENCNCNEQCTCEENCNCNEQCTCEENCECNEQYECKKENKKKKKNKNEEKIKELEMQLEEAVNASLIAKADLVNYRKRKDEEISKMLKYSNEDLVKEMLPIIDTFERAIEMDDDNLEDEVSKFLSGFKMMYCNLITTLEKYGVKAIDGNNKLFDPTYHQAVMTEKRENVESGMVLEVLQKGYLLKDKIIRPAMVKVSE